MLHDVAIIGGGVAGAATAVGFTVAGPSVVLFERRDLARDPNRGDVIHPHARDVLRSWGALEALRERQRRQRVFAPFGNLAAGFRVSGTSAGRRSRPLVADRLLQPQRNPPERNIDGST